MDWTFIRNGLSPLRAIAELVRLDALPKSYMPPPEIAALREKVGRRAFLVRERARLMTKIRSVLAYEGVKPPKEYGLSRAQRLNEKFSSKSFEIFV